jgi:aldose 1-epimerase
MDRPILIGGAPPVTLRRQPVDKEGPAFLEATVLPGRGMMLLQARLRLSDGAVVDAIAAPDLADAARVFETEAGGFPGNPSFSFGGAILAPFANRIRGAQVPGRRQIETDVAGRSVRLPSNWSGKAPGAEPYAMHGLILASRFDVLEQAPERVAARLDAGDFEGCWPGRMRLDVTWRLDGRALRLRTVATNVGAEATPVGLGWHPYFRIPGGDRGQARLWLAAESRALVDNYDDVLPTGAIEGVRGAYDFRASGGRALGDEYLDDCFTDVDGPGLLAELRDPVGGLGLRLSSPSPDIRSIQVFAPPDQPFVVIEPQFNLADPYGAQWRGRDTGMRLLEPGEQAAYEVSVEPFVLPG